MRDWSELFERWRDGAPKELEEAERDLRAHLLLSFTYGVAIDLARKALNAGAGVHVERSASGDGFKLRRGAVAIFVTRDVFTITVKAMTLFGETRQVVPEMTLEKIREQAVGLVEWCSARL